MRQGRGYSMSMMSMAAARGVVVAAVVLLMGVAPPCVDARAQVASVGIEAACRGAASRHPGALDYDDCVSSLSSDERFREAADGGLHALAVAATRAAVEHAASTEAKIDGLHEVEPSPHARARLNHCLEDYAAAADALRDALDYLQARVYGKAGEQLAAALGAAERCEDAWKGEERVPVAGHDKEYGRMALVALGLTSGIV